MNLIHEESTAKLTVADADADARWRTWQAQGARSDLLRGRIVNAVIAVVAIALTVNLVVALAWGK
jgi:hypothetical protein